MKRINKLALTVGLAATVLIGCQKNTGINTGALEKSFAAAEPVLQTRVNKVVASVKAGDYNTAVVELSSLAGNEKLTAPQQQAVAALLQQAQKMVAAAPPKTVDQLPMAMPKPR